MTRPVSLWPREHGAYVQLGFPLLSAWLLGRPTLGSLLLGVAAILAFLAHEPLLLWLGRRGARRKEAAGARASRRLALLGTLSATCGVTALLLEPPLVRLLVLVPVGVGALSLLLAATGRERSLLGELHAATSLASIALPVAVAARVPPWDAVTLVLVWTAGFALATTAARGVLFQKKDARRGLRLAFVVAALATVACAALAASALLPVAIALAPLPFAVAAMALALHPPSPRHMHALGFGLTGACAVTLALLLLAL